MAAGFVAILVFSNNANQAPFDPAAIQVFELVMQVQKDISELHGFQPFVGRLDFLSFCR